MKHHCGKALANADKGILAHAVRPTRQHRQGVCPFGFDTYLAPARPSRLDPGRTGRSEELAIRFPSVAGDDAVLTGEASVDQLGRKGYKPIKAPENLVRACRAIRRQTPGRVLGGRIVGPGISDASPDAQAAVDLVWEWLEEVGLTNGKEKPPVKCFTSILDGGTMLNRYYRDGIVYINRDIAGAGYLAAGEEALPDRLVHVALEEVAHFVTNGATDHSRDFQNFLLDLAVKSGGSGSGRKDSRAVVSETPLHRACRGGNHDWRTLKMGWLSGWHNRGDLVRHLKEGTPRTFRPVDEWNKRAGWREHRILTACFVGNNMWTVHRIIREFSETQESPIIERKVSVFIVLFLLRKFAGGTWGAQGHRREHGTMRGQLSALLSRNGPGRGWRVRQGLAGTCPPASCPCRSEIGRRGSSEAAKQQREGSRNHVSAALAWPRRQRTDVAHPPQAAGWQDGAGHCLNSEIGDAAACRVALSSHWFQFARENHDVSSKKPLFNPGKVVATPAT